MVDHLCHDLCDGENMAQYTPDDMAKRWRIQTSAGTWTTKTEWTPTGILGQAVTPKASFIYAVDDDGNDAGVVRASSVIRFEAVED